MTDHGFRILLLAATPLLLLFAGRSLSEVVTGVRIGQEVPLQPFLVASLLGLAAIGLVVFVAASLANEWQSSADRRDEARRAADAAARSRRLAQVVRHHQVMAAVRSGARDAAEVADALSVHRHVARMRLEELADEGHLVAGADGRYEIAETGPQPTSVPRTGARAARWIDPDDK